MVKIQKKSFFFFSHFSEANVVHVTEKLQIETLQKNVDWHKEITSIYNFYIDAIPHFFIKHKDGSAVIKKINIDNNVVTWTDCLKTPETSPGPTVFVDMSF